MEIGSTSTSVTEPITPAKTAATELLRSSYRRSLSSRTICGDRFIPSRSSSNFSLFDLPNSTDPSSDDSNSAYISLLKFTLFGPECVGAASGFHPSTPEKSFLPGRFGGSSHSKLFAYQSYKLQHFQVQNRDGNLCIHFCRSGLMITFLGFVIVLLRFPEKSRGFGCTSTTR